MGKNQIRKYQNQFLLLNAFILTPIAFSYGFIPEGTFEVLFGVEMNVSSITIKHFMRTLMGLYLSMVGLWILGSRYEHLRVPALYAQVFFMFGVASGRMLSFLIDGLPFWLLQFFFVSEIILGAIGIYLIRLGSNK